MNGTRTKLQQRVETAAEAALRRQKSVAPIDVFNGMGWLPGNLIDDWRRGRIDHLEDVLHVSAKKLDQALFFFQQWAQREGLRPNEVSYVAGTRDRRELRFSADGDASVEKVYRTHWTPPELPEAKRKQVVQRQSRAPDILVIEPLRDWTCASCGDTGPFLVMEDAGPICLTCADMDHLRFLPSGDAALTRRAKKESGLSAVVVRWSRTRKRYERQGTLVEEPALERAEEQCLADEEVRLRRRERDRERRADEDVEFQARMAKAIRRLFPGCPVDRAEAIARHAGTRGSGRVGRSAAGRALDEDAITAAVVASVRHRDTDYDDLLMSGVPREIARARVRSGIDQMLDRWSTST